MNMKSLLSIVAFAALGLIVGYALFGKWGGEYVSLQSLFAIDDNSFRSALRSLTGIEDMRNKILICGGAGAAVGVLLTFRIKK